jgi:hypothetical protein
MLLFEALFLEVVSQPLRNVFRKTWSDTRIFRTVYLPVPYANVEVGRKDAPGHVDDPLGPTFFSSEERRSNPHKRQRIKVNHRSIGLLKCPLLRGLHLSCLCFLPLYKSAPPDMKYSQ